jgi:hypothetical protein
MSHESSTAAREIRDQVARTSPQSGNVDYPKCRVRCRTDCRVNWAQPAVASMGRKVSTIASSLQILKGRKMNRLLLIVAALAICPIATAQQQTAVFLGSAGAYAVLSGTTVTNTGPSIITGDLGVWPGTAVTGFGPGVINGTEDAGDVAAQHAQASLNIA